MVVVLFSLALTIFILDTSKHVFWQTLKTQMKCRINASGSALFAMIKNNLQGQKNIILSKV